PEVAQPAAQEPAAIQSSAPSSDPVAHPGPPNLDTTAAEQDLSEEKAQVEFYLNSGFLGEANTALKDLARRHPGRAEILELQDRFQAASPPSDEPRAFVLDEPAPAGPPTAPDELNELNDTDDTNESDEPNEYETPLFFNVPDQLPAPALAESQARVEETVAPPAERGPEPQFQEGSLLGDLAQELAMALGEAGEQASATEVEAPYRAEEGRSLFDSALEELLTELESGQPAAPTEDSPQTHYNLGVAFREMGLLEEAIGEFQKVVKGRIPADHPPRFLEASSMLGNCFMEKQMPEIAARWYSRALQAPGLEEEIALALTYDLATAYEKSGDLKAAQEKFSEVYSLNIDYRDVSEKIQLLSRSKPA
ncbi:MAG: tetratricopeptide repeat protein, partial [Terriglobia bacterium]